MRVEGTPPYWARPPIWWAPQASIDVHLPPIYTHVPREHQKVTAVEIVFCWLPGYFRGT